MAPPTLYHNPRCSKSRGAKALLDEAGVDYEVVEYLKAPPTRDELEHLRRCCTDPTGGTRSWAGVAGRPLTCLSDAQRALQAEPGPPPPYSPAEA